MVDRSRRPVAYTAWDTTGAGDRSIPAAALARVAVPEAQLEAVAGLRRRPRTRFVRVLSEAVAPQWTLELSAAFQAAAVLRVARGTAPTVAPLAAVVRRDLMLVAGPEETAGRRPQARPGRAVVEAAAKGTFGPPSRVARQQRVRPLLPEGLLTSLTCASLFRASRSP
jgi:hypothetical protein